MLTFIQKVLHNNKKEYMILFIIMSLMASFELSCLAMYFSLEQSSFDYLTTIAMHAIPTLATFIILTLNIFVVKYFIENKKQEFAIILLSGRKPKDLFVYMMIQFGFMTLLAFIVGIIGGNLIIFIINLCLQYLSIDIVLHYQWLYTFGLYVLFNIITIVLILTISSNQFVMLDKQLVLYLAHKKQSLYKAQYSTLAQKKHIPIFSLLFSLVIAFITIGSIMKILVEEDFMWLYVYYLIALCGMIYVIQSIIPLIYDLFHHYFVQEPVLLHALANFNNFSSVMKTMMNLNSILVPTMLFIAILASQNIFLQVFIIPCFVMMVIMICLCFALKYMFYDKEIHKPVAIYHALGYSLQDLKKIFMVKKYHFYCFSYFNSFVVIFIIFI